MPVDVKDTRGIILDDEIDQVGDGMVELELNTGSTPSRATYPRHESLIEDIDLQKLTTDDIKRGSQIRVTATGSEVTEVIYDKRQEASLYLINREFNTATAERANGRTDGVVYKYGEWQGKTVEDVIKYIVDQTNGLLRYEGGAPLDFAGSITFRNTPAPQAITQALAQEGNWLWSCDFDGLLRFYQRDPGRATPGSTEGVVGVNVVEQDLTGPGPEGGRPAKVMDKDGRGKKTQYGGPAWYKSAKPDPNVPNFEAPAPIELVANLTDLLTSLGPGTEKLLNELYGYTNYADSTADGQSSWHKPLSPEGKTFPVSPIYLEAKDPALKGKPWDTKLITHPAIGPVFEILLAEPPSWRLIKYGMSISQAELYEKELEKLITLANGRDVHHIGGSSGEEYAKVEIQRTSYEGFDEKTSTTTGALYAIALVVWHKPKWQSIDGYVDPDAGRLVIPPDSQGAYGHLAPAFEPSSGFKETSYAFWSKDDVVGGGNKFKPVPTTIVFFREAIAAATMRAHVVVAEELGPEIFPAGGSAPFGAIEQGDYQQHNLIFNAARQTGHEEPAKLPRDDRPKMSQRAENLAASISIPALTKGSIKIFPGDNSLQLGQPANGGVIVKIKHTYSPYFSSQFWLDGSPDLQNPEQAYVARKIAEHEGLTQVNSEQQIQASRKVESGAKSGTGTSGSQSIPSHKHSDEFSGGSNLGSVSVLGLNIHGVLPTGEVNLTAEIKDITTGVSRRGVVDLKWLAGLSKITSGGLLVEVEEVGVEGPYVSGRIFSDPKKERPTIGKISVVSGGVVLSSKDEVERVVSKGDVRPLVFVEEAMSTTPTVAILVDERALICDHENGDENDKNRSTPVRDVLGNSGDLDDIMVVLKNIQQFQTKVGGSSSQVSRLGLYVPEVDPQSTDTLDQRLGFIGGANGEWAGLSDLLGYHGTDPRRRASIMTHALHKHLRFLKTAAAVAAPLPYNGKSTQRLGTLKFPATPKDYVYGYLALDDSDKRINAHGDGTWFIEIPFDACEMTSITTQLAILYANDVAIADQMLSNDQDIASKFKANDDALKGAIDLVEASLTAMIESVAAQTNAALAALARAISQCACCFPEVTPITVPEDDRTPPSLQSADPKGVEPETPCGVAESGSVEPSTNTGSDPFA